MALPETVVEITSEVTLPWFSFFLVIMCVWYITIQLRWKKYWFNKQFNQYTDGTLERTIHYLLMGVLVNILFAIWNLRSVQTLLSLKDVFDNAWKLADRFEKFTDFFWIPEWVILSDKIQLIVFIFSWFIIVISLVIVVYCIFKLVWFIFYIIEKYELFNRQSIRDMFWAIKKLLHMDITHVLSYLPIPMLHLYKLVKKVTHHFTMMDWTVAKIDLVVVGLLLAKLFPVLTSAHRGRYVGVIIIAEIYFIQRIRKIVKE